MSTPKISLALGGARKHPPSTNGVKRPRAALHEEDDEDQSFGKTEKVSTFDLSAGGAIDETARKEVGGPLVIAKQENRDWKEAANQRKRQKSGLPENHDAKKGDFDAKIRDVEATAAGKKPQFGLNTFSKRVEERDEDVEMGNGDADVEAGPAQRIDGEEEPAKRSTDDLARDALLGKTTTDETLTIAAEDPISEQAAFNHDFRTAPDMASLDDYARVPVEQFGAALLRGMGWKDGEGIGSQRGKKLPKNSEAGKIPERRAALLGIGAKEDKAVAQEMGAWGRNAKKGKDGEVKIYNPVLLRDKKTGEMFTEEELERKRERDEKANYEAEFERKEKERENKRYRDEDYRDSRDRRREKDGHRHRDDDRRRDRDRGYDRERSPRKHTSRYDGDRRRDDRDRHRDRDRDRRR